MLFEALTPSIHPADTGGPAYPNKNQYIRIIVGQGYRVEGLEIGEYHLVPVDITGSLNLLTGRVRTEGIIVTPYPETMLTELRRQVGIVAPTPEIVTPDGPLTIIPNPSLS